MTCVVPLRQGVFSSYRTLPLRVIDNRFVDTAGRENLEVYYEQGFKNQIVKLANGS